MIVKSTSHKVMFHIGLNVLAFRFCTFVIFFCIMPWCNQYYSILPILPILQYYDQYYNIKMTSDLQSWREWYFVFTLLLSRGVKIPRCFIVFYSKETAMKARLATKTIHKTLIKYENRFSPTSKLLSSVVAYTENDYCIPYYDQY